MAKMKLPPDPWAELETELSQVTTMSRMLVEISALEEPDRVDYFTERLPEHMGRINKAFQQILEEHLEETSAAYEAQKPTLEPLSSSEKRALIKRLERSL